VSWPCWLCSVAFIDLTEKNCFWKRFLLGWNTKSLKFLEEARRSEALAVVGSGFSSDIVVERFIVAIELWASERERERERERKRERVAESYRKNVLKWKKELFILYVFVFVFVFAWERENTRTRASLVGDSWAAPLCGSDSSEESEQHITY